MSMEDQVRRELERAAAQQQIQPAECPVDENIDAAFAIKKMPRRAALLKPKSPSGRKMAQKIAHMHHVKKKPEMHYAQKGG